MIGKNTASKEEAEELEEKAEKRIRGTTIVVFVVVAFVVRVSAAAAATDVPDDDGGVRRRVVWLRSVLDRNGEYSPRGRSCDPVVASSLLSSSFLQTTTLTIFFCRSLIAGHVGSRLRRWLLTLKRMRHEDSLFERRERVYDERCVGSPCVRACKVKREISLENIIGILGSYEVLRCLV